MAVSRSLPVGLQQSVEDGSLEVYAVGTSSKPCTRRVSSADQTTWSKTRSRREVRSESVRSRAANGRLRGLLTGQQMVFLKALVEINI